MKALAFVALALSFAAFAPTSVPANPIDDDLVFARVHFDVPQADLIPGAAAVRASCDVNASGETLVLLAGDSERSTIAASPGPCAIAVLLVGVDVTLPVFNTTPLGKSSFYIPGISTVTLGIVDLSVDLVTSLNATSRVADGIADVLPDETVWTGWGAKRILVRGEDGVGSVATSKLNTTFTYTMSLGLTVYALSIEVYHLNLARIGSFAGAPSLVTDLSVDLRPHALRLDVPAGVAFDRATLSWSGIVDSDIDHLELWLTDGAADVSYRLAAAATAAEVTLRPSTHYDARIVSVDGSGQRAVSPAVGFDTPAGPGSGAAPGVEAQGSAVFAWTMVTLAGLSGVVGFAWGFLRGRRTD